MVPWVPHVGIPLRRDTELFYVIPNPRVFNDECGVLQDGTNVVGVVVEDGILLKSLVRGGGIVYCDPVETELVLEV